VQEQAAEVTPSEPGLDVRDLLYQFARQKWVILGALVLITGVTLLVTLGLDKVYQAEGTLEYDPTPPRPLGSNVEGVENTAGTFLMAKEWYQTQNRIIGSKRILRKVVDRLGLARDPEFMGIPEKRRATWKGEDPEVAVAVLKKNLTIVQEKETRIVRLEVESTSPQKAALLVNTIADAYISWIMEERLGSTVNAVDWLGGQLDDITARLETSELALHTFRRTNNVLSVSIGDQQNVVTETIQSFSQALAEMEKRRIGVAARLRQLQEANRESPFDVHSGLFSQNPAVAALRAKYQDAVVQRDSLITRYGVNHPDMQSIQARIDGLTAEARQEIDGLLLSSASELREVEDVLKGLRGARQRAQNEGLELNLREIEYNQLERTKANNEKLHALLLQRTAETNLTRMFQVSPVRVVDTATPPKSPIRPRVGITVMIGAFVGLLAGLGLAILRTRMDRSIAGPDDIAAVRVHMLGLVPSIAADRSGLYANAYYGKRRRRRANAVDPKDVDKDLIVHTHPRSIVAECCRTIRTNLAFMTTEKPLRTVLITSPGPSEGKTTMAVSLAITMAQSGRRTLLVDTDLRRPRVHKVFGYPLHAGVTRILAGESDVTDTVRKTDIENLWVLPAGPIPPNPAELMHTKRFAALLAELQEQFDLVVLDSPPIGAVTDAAVIGPQVDGVLVIVRSERTTRDTLANAARQLREVKANLLGCVLNEADLSRRRTYKGYYYGGYYSTENEDGGGGGDAGNGGSSNSSSGSSLPERPILDQA
jgi:polysaccharide biosynthesis transport protein